MPKRKRRKPRRDFLSRRYCVWRALVRRRDGDRCRLCGCPDNGKPYPDHSLEVHHILPWSANPRTRFAVSNGVTLCRRCHAFVTGHERRYAAALKRLIR